MENDLMTHHGLGPLLTAALFVACALLTVAAVIATGGGVC